MTTNVFTPTMSTNEIWRDNDTTRCLTDDLDAMDSIHNALPTTYASINHTHTEYITQSNIAPIPINNGADLNNILDIGIYYRALAASDENVVSNVPPAMYSSPFVLEVLRAGSGNQIIQRATRCHKTSKAIAERTYYGGAWGEWETTYVNGKRVLWSGAKYMNASQTIDLSENISNMPHGIVLIFSGYSDNATVDIDFQSFFVPKYLVDTHSGKGSCFMMTNSNGTKVGRKYLYISDNQITGNANSTAIGSASGIDWNSNYFVLRYVIGV